MPTELSLYANESYCIEPGRLRRYTLRQQKEQTQWTAKDTAEPARENSDNGMSPAGQPLAKPSPDSP